MLILILIFFFSQIKPPTEISQSECDLCISQLNSGWFDDYCGLSYSLNSNSHTFYVLISAQEPYTNATLNFTGGNILTEGKIFSAIESVNQKTIKLQTDVQANKDGINEFSERNLMQDNAITNLNDKTASLSQQTIKLQSDVQTNKDGINTNWEELSDLQPKVLDNNKLIKEGINENAGISSTIQSVKQILTDKILKLEQSNTTIHEQIKHLINCDDFGTGSKYKQFGQRCYYFEVSKMNFANAQSSCKTKFGNNGGYLAEPLTKSGAIELSEYADEILNTTDYWIGYDNIGRGNKDFR